VTKLGLAKISHETCSNVCAEAGPPQSAGDFPDNETGGDRHSAEMQDRRELCRRELEISGHEGSRLGVSVLLDDEHLIMLADKFRNLECEREGANAQRVDMKAVAREKRLSLVYRRRGRSVADASRLRRWLQHRTRQEASRGLKLA
jgi:hypothetical protein